MTPLVSLRQAFSDVHLLGAVMGGESREAMRALLLASQGEELSESEREHFRNLTQRDCEPLQRVEEMHVYAGRRSGKSSGIAALAVYAACLCDFSDKLSSGETGIVLVIAENQRQARILFDYISGVIEQSSALRKLVIGRTQTTLTLSNSVVIEVRSADFRGLRGLTLLLVCAEEICHWRSENSANPDAEIVNAVRPALSTTGGQLVSLGSPYSRTGFGYETFRRDFGPHGDPLVIVANGPTRKFNPSISQRIIDRAIQRDPSSAASEWLGEFRNDIDAFLPRKVIETCIVPGRYEIPPIASARYHGFCDPSGGSSDDMALAIAHREKDIAVLDCVRVARPPFSPDAVIADFCSTLKSYGVHSVRGDRYAGEWPVERSRAHGVRYENAVKPKSDLYRDTLPIFNAQRCELLDLPRLAAQLIGLERRTSHGGRDSIDHAPGAHDDLANCVCGALVLALVEKARMMIITPAMLEKAAEPTIYSQRIRAGIW